MRKINTNQRLYCDDVYLNNMTKTDAYIKHFKATNRDYALRYAGLLEKKSYVASYIDKICNRASNKAVTKGIWNIEKARDTLLDLSETFKKHLEKDGSLNSTAAKSILSSIDQLNDICGLKRQNIVANVSNTINEKDKELLEKVSRRLGDGTGL